VIGAVILVSSTGTVDAAHVVLEPTADAWREAEEWLTENGTDGRLLLRIVPPSRMATFTLSTTLPDLLAAGWLLRVEKHITQGSLL
jgi:hypothetical protein